MRYYDSKKLFIAQIIIQFCRAHEDMQMLWLNAEEQELDFVLERRPKMASSKIPLATKVGDNQISEMWQGRPQDLAWGGPRIFFFRFGNLHVAKRHVAHGEDMRIARRVRGHAPPRNFSKWCNFVRFGVYFDQILSLKNFKNYHFLYKKFKNCNFLYKRINILDTRLPWGNYSREEIF